MSTLDLSNSKFKETDSQDKGEDIWDIGDASPYGLRKEYNKKGVKKHAMNQNGSTSIMFSKDNI